MSVYDREFFDIEQVDKMRELMTEFQTLIQQTQDSLVAKAVLACPTPFVIHLYSWLDERDGRADAKCAGNWVPIDIGECKVIRHDFGEVAPWLSADGASLAGTTAAESQAPGGPAPVDDAT